jgi:hypothetical protein
MKTQKGTITIMKRYRQFLDLHHRVRMLLHSETAVSHLFSYTRRVVRAAFVCRAAQLQHHYKASVMPKFPKKRYLGNNTSHKFIQKRVRSAYHGHARL